MIEVVYSFPGDLRGKGGNIRTIPVPAWVKQSVDSWSLGAGINIGPLLRSMSESEEQFWGRFVGRLFHIRSENRHLKSAFKPSILILSLRRLLLHFLHNLQIRR